MVKIEVGGDLDKQYASVATSFFYHYKFNVFSCELQCICYEKN